MKRIILSFLLLASLMIPAGCGDIGTAGDIYVHNIITTDNSTHSIGDNSTVFADIWATRLHTDNLSIGGLWFPQSNGDNSTVLLGDYTWGTMTGSSGNISVLNDLTDVNVPSPSDGQVLTFDSGTGTWISENATGGTYTDEMAQDAVGGILATTSSLALQYNDIGNIISGYTTLVTNGMTNLEGIPHGDGTHIFDNATLDDLWDVNVPAPTNGQVLTYDNTTGTWVADDASGGLTSPLTADLDFAYYKAITMTCDNGAIVPASPVAGTWFLHTPTGRKVLMMYDGSNWIPIISLGTMTVYVDKTDGTDSIDKGGAVDGGAFKTVQYAVDRIPGLVGGNVTIYINAESYDESVTVKGKGFTGNYSILIYGTLTSLATANQDSSVQGTGSTQGSITDAGAFGAYDNKLIYSSNNAEYRIIDSDSANTATIVGCWSAAPTNSYTVYDWGTDINSITVDGVNKVSLYNLKLDTLISLAVINNGVCFVYQCDVINNANVYADGKLVGYDSYFTATATHCVRVWRASYTEMARCKFYSNGAWMWGIILADNSAGVVSQGCIFDSASTSNTRGIDASLSSSCDMSQSAASGYCRVRNLGIGIASYQGGQVIGTANNQYSGNLANETATAASYGYID